MKRGIVHNKVQIVHPVTVIQDSCDLMVAQLVPGTPCKIPARLVDKWSNHPHTKSRWDEQDSQNWEMCDWIWQHRRALILLYPHRYYAVYLFWAHSNGNFEGWYVNFQMPFTRTDFSIDTLDLEIDLIVTPEHTWHWKDEEEYMAGIKRGSISPEIADEVEKSRIEVLAMVDAKDSPFDTGWLNWQPDPSWAIPQLHSKWQDVG